MANISTIRGIPTKGSMNTPFSLDRQRLRVPWPMNPPVPQPTGIRPPVQTGGGLPPTAVNPMQTGGGLPPSMMPTVQTGGGLPPTAMPTVQTGGGLPPSPLNLSAQMGVELPPSSLSPVQTGGGHQMSPIQSGSPAPLDGSQYVATTTGSGQGVSAMDTVTQFANQFAMQPGESPTSVAQRYAAQFGTTPDQLPVEVVQQINNAFQQQQRPSASATAMGALDDLMSREGSYITNARRRGLEQANSRGMLNSSIGAGSAQRAATEAAMPIFNEIMGLNNQREAQDFQATMASRNLAGQFAGMDRQALIDLAQQQFALAGTLEGQARDAALTQARDAFNAVNQLSGQREQNAFTGQQAQLDRTQGVNDALLGSVLDERRMITDAGLRQQLQSDSVTQQDWLSDRQFQREFNGALSTMAIGGAYDLNRAIMDYAAQNPEIYTPEIISGMTNFFQMNMTGLLQQYFPQLAGGPNNG